MSTKYRCTHDEEPMFQELEVADLDHVAGGWLPALYGAAAYASAAAGWFVSRDPAAAVRMGESAMDHLDGLGDPLGAGSAWERLGASMDGPSDDGGSSDGGGDMGDDGGE